MEVAMPARTASGGSHATPTGLLASQASASALTARLGRAYYLGFTTSGAMLTMASGGIAGYALIELGAETPGLIAIACGLLATVALLLLLAIRRCHDIGITGWAAPLALIPPMSLLLMLVPGTAGSNRFGPPPAPPRPSVALPTILLPVLALAGCLVADIAAFENFNEARDRADQANAARDRAAAAEPRAAL